ncbi:MAG: RidA family protein [Spirochaetota bacterium]
MYIEEKIDSLGKSLPTAPAAIAAYIPAKQVGTTILTSGQLPLQEGKVILTGKLGKDITIEDTKEAAELACLNALAATKALCGKLDAIKQVVRVVVYVNSAADFYEQHLVANHASEFLAEIFGEKGKHCRSAVGVYALPLNSCLELELTVEV